MDFDYHHHTEKKVRREEYRETIYFTIAIGVNDEGV